MEKFTIKRFTRFITLGSIVVASVLISACSLDKTGPRANANVDELFYELKTDHRAVLMSTVAPYDKIQLTSTPYNVKGEILPVEGDFTYTSSAPERLMVSSTGEIQALAVGTNINVYVGLRMRNSYRIDTVRVTITNTVSPPELTSFSIQPAVGDSAKWAVTGGNIYSRPLRPLVLSGATPIPSSVVHYAVADRSILTVGSFTGALTGVRVGKTKIVATTTAYGIRMVDSLEYTISMPASAYVEIFNSGFSPTVDSISIGGSIIWTNWVITPVDIVFDDPTNVAEGPFPCSSCSIDEGNVEPFAADDTEDGPEPVNVSRSFPVAGTYNYRSTITGKTGVIVVVDESASPASTRMKPSRQVR